MEQSAQEAWKQCLDLIRDSIPRQSYKTWFEPLRVLKLEQDDEQTRLTVQLPSRFYFEWLEEHYFSLLRRTITKVLGPQGRLYYDIAVERTAPPMPARRAEPAPTPAGMLRPFADEERPAERPAAEPRPERAAHAPDRPPAEARPPAESRPAPPVRAESLLNPSYTFERHIEGDCNRLARSASLAIAEQPGATSFNPFLIYGGVGLGKTHLIQAIGNYARMYNKVGSVLYVSSERFTNDFVQSIQHNRVSDFSMYYRQIDLIIVDDIQFFSGKEKTQEEFFHIFNALHQSGKQIVLSADRPPREIQGIEERLLSRFQWGLSADVQPPELETRIAILQRKAEDDGIEMPPDVIDFVAHNVKSNIRELEGAMIRLLAQATLYKREIDLMLAKEVLRDLLKDVRVNLSIEDIQRATCEYFNISENQVRDKTRKREVVQARQVAMYFSKQLTQHSLKTIGLHFGGRDHSTVIHACQSVENQIETDPKFHDMMDELKRILELRSR